MAVNNNSNNNNNSNSNNNNDYYSENGAFQTNNNSNNGNASPVRPSVSERASTAVQRVEGRVVQQDHAQYALTYGMMLGIRVSVR